MAHRPKKAGRKVERLELKNSRGLEFWRALSFLNNLNLAITQGGFKNSSVKVESNIDRRPMRSVQIGVTNGQGQGDESIASGRGGGGSGSGGAQRDASNIGSKTTQSIIYFLGERL